MDCYVAASSGALKGLNFSRSAVTNLNECDVSKLNPVVDEITAMCFADMPGSFQQNIFLCQRDRQLKVFNTKTLRFCNLLEVEGGKGSITGVQFVGSSQRVITGVESGEVRIWESGEKLAEIFKNENSIRECGTVDDDNAEFLITPRSSLSSLTHKPENLMLKSNAINSGGHLSTIRLHPIDTNILATGGKENLLKCWDLEKMCAIFTAKNVRQDDLELRVPINESNFRFIGVDGKLIATSTGAHQIRLYDPRSQRRPIDELKWLEVPIHALSTCYRENYVMAGNNMGELGLFDLRFKQAKISLVSKFRGFAGAIRSIDAHPTAPIAASCGADRFVVLHDLNTRAILKKFFCKVQLNDVLLCGDNSISNPKSARKLIQAHEKDVFTTSGGNDPLTDSSDDEEEETDKVSLDDLLEKI